MCARAARAHCRRMPDDTERFRAATVKTWPPLFHETGLGGRGTSTCRVNRLLFIVKLETGKHGVVRQSSASLTMLVLIFFLTREIAMLQDGGLQLGARSSTKKPQKKTIN